MNRRRCCMLIGAALACPGPVCAASELIDIYSSNRLTGERVRLEGRIRELYRLLVDLIVRNGVSAGVRRVLEELRLDFPLSDPSGSPLNFSSEQTTAGSVVRMPIVSLLFLEDLCTAYAWMDRHGYSPETVDEYVAMLQYKPAAEFAGRRYPAPLEALRIPASAVDEPDAGPLGLRLRNSAYAFILAHEIGHVVFGHPSYERVSRGQARQNEAQADRFALDVLALAGNIPLGAVLYFEASAFMMPNRGAFIAQGRSGAEADAAIGQQTHPLTADRLQAIALQLDEQASRSQSGSERETLRYIASRLETISVIVSDPDLQQCMAVAARRAQMSDLEPQRPGLSDRFLGKCIRR
jgi:hypothetical protein